MNQNGLTLEQALSYLGAMTVDGKQGSLPVIKGLTAKSVTKYISCLGSALAPRNGSLIVPSDKKETGITNFENGNILPAGKYLLIFGLRQLFDNSTANVTPLIAKWKDEAPVAYKNGELIISQTGAGVLAELTGTDVSNFKASYGNDADFRSIVPILIRPEARFDIQQILAGAGGAEAVKTELRCIEFNDSSKN